MRLASAISVLALLLGCAGPVPLEDAIDAAPVAQKSPCGAGEFRQFDFWIGEWDVRVQGGKLAGRNRIEVINNGCALRESYSTPTGYQGSSFNIYDASRGVWHQTWVDNGGLLLTIEGGLQGSSMVLTGTRTRATPQGDVLDRISWTPGEDGSVRQVWEVSGNGGTDWKVIFDGRYERRHGEDRTGTQD